tara:strand:+ start:12846 stop:13367 length:522 start_codon:yes stop_codon:yes gene_type:complete
MHTSSDPNTRYRAALSETDPSQFSLPESGSPEEAQMLDGVRQFFSEYTRSSIDANIDSVYAENLYFRDAFRQFDNRDAVQAYLVNGLEPLDQAEFQINRIISQNGEYYIDWLMRLDFKKTPKGTWEESIGMTHLRFNDAGKVIFHQDYWDPTDIVYRRIPVAKQLIAYAQGKM